MAGKDMFLQNFDWKRHKPLCKTVQSQLARTVTATIEQRSADRVTNPADCATVTAAKWLGTSIFTFDLDWYLDVHKV